MDVAQRIMWSLMALSTFEACSSRAQRRGLVSSLLRRALSTQCTMRRAFPGGLLPSFDIAANHCWLVPDAQS